MQVFDITTIDKAVAWLDKGGLLSYPTEAVWGIGCDPFNEQAVKSLLKLKNRPIEKGLIVITSSSFQVQAFLQPLPIQNQQIIEQSWNTVHNPVRQATTWLFPIPPNLPRPIPDWVTGGRDTLAIREIAHAKICRLCDEFSIFRDSNNPYGFLISTSCNPNGKPPATTLAQAQQYFGDTIAYFDDETLGFTEPSQIRHALTGEIIRE